MPGSAAAELATARDDQVAARDGLANARFLLGRRDAALADVAQALSSFGVAPRELASLLQALHTAGALRAEVVVQ